jgi:hypothetical protein
MIGRWTLFVSPSMGRMCNRCTQTRTRFHELVRCGLNPLLRFVPSATFLKMGSRERDEKVTRAGPLATPHRPNSPPPRRDGGELPFSREVQWVRPFLGHFPVSHSAQFQFGV